MSLTSATSDEPAWPGAFALGGEARTLAMQAWRAMPGLFVVALIVLVALGFAEQALSGRLTIPLLAEIAHKLASFGSGTKWSRAGAALALFGVDVLVAAAVAVATHRFILLGERSGGPALFIRRCTWRYVLWTIALGCACMPVFLIPNAAVSFAAKLALSILLMRVLLVLPAVAIGTSASNPVGRIRTSWRLTQGRAFPLYFGAIVAAFPFMLVGLAISLLGLLPIPGEDIEATDFASRVAHVIGSAFSEVAVTACLAALASRAWQLATDQSGDGAQFSAT